MKTYLRKHINNKDVAAEFLGVDWDEERQKHEVFVCWWNIGDCHDPWSMNLYQTILLTEDQLQEWKPYMKWKDIRNEDIKLSPEGSDS